MDLDIIATPVGWNPEENVQANENPTKKTFSRDATKEDENT
jgi:hypothetical protein